MHSLSLSLSLSLSPQILSYMNSLWMLFHTCLTFFLSTDLDYIDEVRRQMPLEDIRRNDIYKTIDMTSESSI